MKIRKLITMTDDLSGLSAELRIRKEISKSKLKAERLINGFPHKSENVWDKEETAFLKIRLVLEDLLYRKIITKKMEQKIQRSIAPSVYRHILNEPQLVENDKLRELVRDGLKKDWAYKNGVSLKW